MRNLITIQLALIRVHHSLHISDFICDKMRFNPTFFVDPISKLKENDYGLSTGFLL